MKFCDQPTDVRLTKARAFQGTLVTLHLNGGAEPTTGVLVAVAPAFRMGAVRDVIVMCRESDDGPVFCAFSGSQVVRVESGDWRVEASAG